MTDHECLCRVLKGLESYGFDWSDDMGTSVAPLGKMVAKQLNTKYEDGKYYDGY